MFYNGAADEFGSGDLTNRCDIMMYFEPDQKPLNDSHKYRENGVIKSEEE